MTEQELKIETAYNEFPFEIPSINWTDETGYILESPSQEEIKNISELLKCDPIHDTDMEATVSDFLRNR